MRWLNRRRRDRGVLGTAELTEEIRLVRAQLSRLTVTLADFDRRLIAAAERIYPDRTTTQWKETPGE